MKIAVISTINMVTPPVGYGGIERLVHNFVEELIHQGHTVTLFAREGSHCSGRTVGVPTVGTSSGGAVRMNEEGLHDAMLATFASERPDVIHDWSLENLFVNRQVGGIPFVASTCVPQGPAYAQVNVVAASAAHAATLKGGSVPFVRFGIAVEKIEFAPVGGLRLAHVAKIARYKAQHLSMMGAAMARMQLDVVGNVEGRRYAKYVVEPLAAVLPNVRLTGESMDVNATLARARALVLTPRWFETFPLVSLQSLAAGTPVVAFASGGLPEQIEHGVNGFIAHGLTDFAQLIRRVSEIDRATCRATAMERFHVSRMVREYVEIYQRVLDGETW